MTESNLVPSSRVHYYQNQDNKIPRILFLKFFLKAHNLKSNINLTK